MLILALDTTSEKGRVGIFRDAACLALASNEGLANQYSISVFEMAGQALAEARLELRQMELFAVANGPGSFTGIRTGLAAARAWGKAFDRPVRGVSVLEAMVGKSCQRVSPELPCLPGGESIRPGQAGEALLPSLGPAWYFPILDARRGEFFFAGFCRAESDPSDSAQPEYEPADSGWVLKLESLRALLEERLAEGASATCLVRARDQAAAGLRTALPSTLNWETVDDVLVDSVAGIARRNELSGRPRRGTELDAYYLRRPDAEVNWKDD